MLFRSNLELGYNRLENDFTVSGGMTNNGERGWDSHANYLYAEVGVTYNLGKASWDAVPDVDAIKAGYQSSIQSRTLMPSPYTGKGLSAKALAIIKGISFSGKWYGP